MRLLLRFALALGPAAQGTLVASCSLKIIVFYEERRATELTRTNKTHNDVYEQNLCKQLVCFHTKLTDETKLASPLSGFILIQLVYLELRQLQCSQARQP